MNKNCDKNEIFFEGYMYDVSSWIPRHPGGKIIKFYTNCDENATQAIYQFHNRSEKKVQAILKSMKKRPASPDELKRITNKRHDALSEDFQKLFQDVKSEGLFEPSIAHIGLRLGELVLCLFLTLYLAQFPQLICKIGCCLSLAILRFRSGYLMHEGGHRSLTGKPKVDNFIQEIVAGVGLGFSSSWWNSQHNRHHAMPQRVQRDVDLDTLPLIAFNAELSKYSKQNCSNFFIRNQKYLFIFIDTLLVGFLFSLVRSPRYAYHNKKWVQLFGMFLTIFALPWYMGGMTLWIIGTYLATLNLFGNFSLNHTHLPVTSEPLHWVEYSFAHTANVKSSRFINWWSGHLAYQIEHHLMPTLPQFRCAKVAPRVRKLAEKHGLEYKCYGYWEAAKKVFDNLDHVSKEIELGQKKL